ncbi:MAG: hypothetical protein ABH883_02080 [Candidatus Omnitrophota bacterium]
MKRIFMFGFVLLWMYSFTSPYCASGEAGKKEIVFDFEDSTDSWRIPDWAYYQGDHVATEMQLAGEEASSGKSALKIMCDFPGDSWAAALIDLERPMDLSGYNTISADVYLPKKAPEGLMQARIILTCGDGWHFIEMRSAVPLKHGKWVTVKANLEKEEVPESEWKGRKEKRLFLHIDKIKKIAVRVEYDAAPPSKVGPRYTGPVYVDNIVIK